MRPRHPHVWSFLVFLPFVAIGLVSFFYFDSAFYAYGSFLACSFFGMGFSRCVFDRTATPEEKQADLEDRVRNPPL